MAHAIVTYITCDVSQARVSKMLSVSKYYMGMRN